MLENNMTKSQQTIDTILFDFDGTLMDTNEVILASWQHAFVTLTGKECDVDKILSTFGEPLEYSIKMLMPDFDTDEVLPIYRDYQLAHYEEMIELFPGVEDMLATLHDNGYKMAIVTNRLRPTTEVGMKKYGLDKFFSSVVACNEAARNKPFAEPLLLALEQLGSSPESAILVGDSANDILSGKNADLKTVRVSWAVALDGSHDEESVIPDYIIDTPQELVELLKEI